MTLCRPIRCCAASSPCLFEDLPAGDQRADAVYLSEVDRCDVYVGLFGNDYGFEDAAGVSPTVSTNSTAPRRVASRALCS